MERNPVFLKTFNSLLRPKTGEISRKKNIFAPENPVSDKIIFVPLLDSAFPKTGHQGMVGSRRATAANSPAFQCRVCREIEFKSRRDGRIFPNEPEPRGGWKYSRACRAPRFGVISPRP